MGVTRKLVINPAKQAAVRRAPAAGREAKFAFRNARVVVLTEKATLLMMAIS